MSAIDELRRASFRGVSFHVDEEEGGQKRSVVVHEYAGTSRWDTEDHGLKAPDIRVTAYLADQDGVRAASEALWSVCRAEGPGLLVLPHAPADLVYCTGIRRSLRRDRLGYIAFSLDFVPESGDPLGLSALLLPSQAAAAFAQLTSSLGTMLSALPLFGRRVISAFEDTARSLGAALALRTGLLADRDVGAIVAALQPRLAVSPQADDRGQTLAEAFADAVEALRVSEDREVPQILVDAASGLSAAELAAPPETPPAPADVAVRIPIASPRPVPRAASRRAAALVTASVRDTLRALAAAAYARRLMIVEHPTRDAAIEARAALSALVDPLLDEGALDEPSFAALATIQGLASGHLIDVMTSLAPIVRVETAKPLSACLAAWQLYGDTARAEELVRRNNVATPCFMPTVFEAVAPKR